VLPLLLTTYLVSSNAGILFNFLGIYLSERGGSAQVVGAASGAAAISELPVLLFGSKLVDRFGSRRVLLFAIIIYLVRLTLLSLPITPHAALVVQLLHGLSFGAFLIGSVTLVHELVGRERAATAQGLLASMSFGFGSITGSLVGGALLEQIGTVGIFRVAAAGMLAALVIYLLTLRASAARHTSVTAVPPHHESAQAPTEA
jgi:PPP family 3-phenylpropionic acid transporter